VTVWPFGRGRDRSSRTDGQDDETVAGGDGSDAVAPVHEWARLAPVARITESAPSVINRDFDRDLASWQKPLVLRQLDHLVSSQAPAGVIVTDAVLARHDRADSAIPDRPTPRDADRSIVTFEPPRRPVPTLTEQPRAIPATIDAGAPPSDAQGPAEGQVAPTDPPIVASGPRDDEDAATSTVSAIEHSPPASFDGALETPAPPSPTPSEPPLTLARTTGEADASDAMVAEPLLPPAPPASGRRLGLGAPLPDTTHDIETPSIQRSTVPSTAPIASSPGLGTSGLSAPLDTTGTSPSTETRAEQAGPLNDIAAPDEAALEESVVVTETAPVVASPPDAPIPEAAPSESAPPSEADGPGADVRDPGLPPLEAEAPETVAPVLPLASPVQATEPMAAAGESGVAPTMESPSMTGAEWAPAPLAAGGDETADQTDTLTRDGLPLNETAPVTAALTGDRPDLLDRRDPGATTFIQRHAAAEVGDDLAPGTLPSIAPPAPETVSLPLSTATESSQAPIAPTGPEPAEEESEHANARFATAPMDATEMFAAPPRDVGVDSTVVAPAGAESEDPLEPPTPMTASAPASPVPRESPETATAPVIAQRLAAPLATPPDTTVAALSPGSPAGSPASGPMASSSTLEPMVGLQSSHPLPGTPARVVQPSRVSHSASLATVPLSIRSSGSPPPPSSAASSAEGSADPPGPVAAPALPPGVDEPDVALPAATILGRRSLITSHDVPSILGVQAFDADSSGGDGAGLRSGGPESFGSGSPHTDVADFGLGPSVQRQSTDPPVAPSPATYLSLSRRTFDAPAGPPPAPPSVPEPSGVPRPWRDAGEVAIQSLIAQRQPDGSVVFNLDGGASNEAGPPADVQRAAGENAAPAPAPAPHGAGGADTGDLDELAKRLYGRLRVMLKHELRLDHERAGSLIQRR
jgi:hypothetical protein